MAQSRSKPAVKVQEISSEYFEPATRIDTETRLQRTELDYVATFADRSDAVKFASENNCQFVVSEASFPDAEHVVYRIPREWQVRRQAAQAWTIEEGTVNDVTVEAERMVLGRLQR